MERLLKWTIKCFLTALSFTFVCGCDFDIVGRKTLVWGPCRSIQKSKELGFYVYSYRWIYTPYVCCEMDTIITISEAFLEQSHRWLSYDSDSVVSIDNCYDFVVRCKSSNKNIIFPNLIYGDWYKEKSILNHQFRDFKNLGDINDTIATHVVWVPDSHFDQFGRYDSLRVGFYDFNDIDAYKKFKPADGAVVLGLLQFVRKKD
ncbi:MAG: hypothetical protein U0L67_09850 [Paludibacteraceae bacterium]|jgi:hypothetical protein|nr:hypothetical protein [Paludibacteraceae bacterium]